MATKIVIFGGAGFVGTNLVRRVLQEPKVRITVVDSLDPRFQSTKENLADVLSRIEFIQGDIRDEGLLKDVIHDAGIIFNCAGQTSHPYSLENPILDTEINCIGNLALLMAVKNFNARAIVVYPSSSTIIGKAVGDVVDETHGEKPLDVYSANKGVAEKYYRIFNRVHDIRTVVLRFANLYGPYGKSDPSFGFVNHFIHQVMQNKPIKLYGTGEQTRNVMFIDDATEILWQAAHLPHLHGESFFAVHPEHHSVLDIAETIVDVFERGSVESVPWPDVRKRIEIDRVIISSARLRSLHDWRPAYSLRQGLEKTKQLMASGI